MPGFRFEPDTRWRDTGADSLQMLTFVLRLERELGQAVGLDLLGPETTATALARTLASRGRMPLASAPDIYLIPGVGGDEPSLSAFRRALAPELNFATLTLPDIDAPTSVLASVAKTAALMLPQIDIVGHPTPILMGYSFGGLVAVEMAVQLEAKGVKVRGVVLLDPLLAPDETPQAYLAGRIRNLSTPKLAGPARSEDRRPAPRLPARDNMRRVRDHLIGSLFRIRSARAAQLIFPYLSSSFKAKLRPLRRLQLLAAFRSQAARRWRPGEYTGRVLLIVSNDPRARRSLGRWASICPGAKIEHIPGLHRDILKPEMIPRLKHNVLEQLQ